MFPIDDVIMMELSGTEDGMIRENQGHPNRMNAGFYQNRDSQVKDNTVLRPSYI